MGGLRPQTHLVLTGRFVLQVTFLPTASCSRAEEQLSVSQKASLFPLEQIGAPGRFGSHLQAWDMAWWPGRHLDPDAGRDRPVGQGFGA